MLKSFLKIKIHLITAIIVTAAIIIFMLLVQNGIIGLTTNLGKKSEPTETTDISMTVEKTLPVSEMNGLVISMEKIIDSEDSGIPLLTKKKMLIEASWKIKLGINAKNIKVSTNEHSKTITVTLPKIQVNSMEQASTPKIYDQSGSLLDSYSSQAG